MPSDSLGAREFSIPMRHSLTRQLHAYWQRQRDGRPAPLRSAIEPAHIAGLLGDVFILDASKAQSFPFRLAGTRLCAGIGRELTGESFLSLWRGADREAVRAALTGVTRDAAAVVLDLAGRTGRGSTLAMEMLLLPLSQDGRHLDRVLGLLAPLERPYWLGLHPIPRLEIAGLRWLPVEESQPLAARPLPAAARPAPREATPAVATQPAGRRRQHLVVLDGGRD
ncbi:hypothetical protein ABIE08_001613 [Kaistia defluvii]|uniref:PAS domain-containing protein n=1 Tax=Kaistia defluvii TaxID=410841 RepID=A0ABV2QZ54_9HYPH